LCRTRSHIHQEDQTTNDGYEKESVPELRPSRIHAQSVWKKSYLKEFISESYFARLSFNLLKEVALMMMRFNAPPIIREYIEGAQNDNEEGC
jgi:hypothetical protein